MVYINNEFGIKLEIEIVNSEELGDIIWCSEVKFVCYNNKLIELNEKNIIVVACKQ
ncbi:hypothetical protein [Clostridium butyricum]